MTLRTPPGRMGVMWLRERLDIANRAREVLEEKLEALTREHHRVETELHTRREEWERLLARAEQSLLAAELAGGSAQVDRVAALTPPANVEVAAGRTLGVPHPAGVDLTTPPRARAPWGDSSALPFAAVAYREALAAGARHAVTVRAVAVLERERARTARRLRSIERRWIPQLEVEFRDASRTLDEAEREDTVRISWVARGGA